MLANIYELLFRDGTRKVFISIKEHDSGYITTFSNVNKNINYLVELLHTQFTSFVVIYNIDHGLNNFRFAVQAKLIK